MTAPAYFDRLMASVAWTETHKEPPQSGLYATHEGALDVLGMRLRVYRLNNGEAVFDADDTASLFEQMGRDQIAAALLKQNGSLQ